jgi:WD40 repeat protein
LASGAKDSEARVWDASSSTCLGVAAGHVATVNAVAWSRSKGKVGRYLATGGADKLLKLWDTSALLDRNTGRSGAPGATLAFTPCFCLSIYHEQVKIWLSFEQVMTVYAVVALFAIWVSGMSPEDVPLFTNCVSGMSPEKVPRTVRLGITCSVLITMSRVCACVSAGPVALSTVAAVAAHDKEVNALSFSPNDGILATASQDKTIKLWQVPSLVLVATLRGHKRGVWDVAFSPAEKVKTGSAMRAASPRA